MSNTSIHRNKYSDTTFNYLLVYFVVTYSSLKQIPSLDSTNIYIFTNLHYFLFYLNTNKTFLLLIKIEYLLYLSLQYPSHYLPIPFLSFVYFVVNICSPWRNSNPFISIRFISLAVFPEPQ